MTTTKKDKIAEATSAYRAVTGKAPAQHTVSDVLEWVLDKHPFDGKAIAEQGRHLLEAEQSLEIQAARYERLHDHYDAVCVTLTGRGDRVTASEELAREAVEMRKALEAAGVLA